MYRAVYDSLCYHFNTSHAVSCCVFGISHAIDSLRNHLQLDSVSPYSLTNPSEDSSTALRSTSHSFHDFSARPKVTLLNFKPSANPNSLLQTRVISDCRSLFEPVVTHRVCNTYITTQYATTPLPYVLLIFIKPRYTLKFLPIFVLLHPFLLLLPFLLISILIKTLRPIGHFVNVLSIYSKSNKLKSNSDLDNLQKEKKIRVANLKDTAEETSAGKDYTGYLCPRPPSFKRVGGANEKSIKKERTVPTGTLVMKFIPNSTEVKDIIKALRRIAPNVGIIKIVYHAFIEDEEDDPSHTRIARIDYYIKNNDYQSFHKLLTTPIEIKGKIICLTAGQAKRKTLNTDSPDFQAAKAKVADYVIDLDKISETFARFKVLGTLTRDVQEVVNKFNVDNEKLKRWVNSDLFIYDDHGTCVGITFENKKATIPDTGKYLLKDVSANREGDLISIYFDKQAALKNRNAEQCDQSYL